MITGQEIVVLLDHVVNKRPYLIRRQLRRGMRIKQSRLIDAIPFLRQRRLDRQSLHGNTQVHYGGELGGYASDADRLNAVVIDMAWNFDDAFVRQILDQAVVRNISIDQRGLAGDRSMNDAGRIFVAPANIDRLAAFKIAAQLVPLGNLHLATANIFIQGDIEPLDQIATALLDIPGCIFREMLARFRDEVAKSFQNVETHPIVSGNASFFDQSAQTRIEVLAAAVGVQFFIFEKEGDMVDAGREIIDVGDILAKAIGKMGGCVLYAVAETNGPDARSNLLDRPAIDRHRVDVLHEQGIRAHFFHIAADRFENGNGAKPAEDTADPERIGDGLPETMPFRDLEVSHRGRLIAADLHHQDDEIRTFQRLPAIKRRLDAHLVELKRLAEPAGNDLGGFQALRIDVEEADGVIATAATGKDVAQDILGKDGAAGTDQADLWHEGISAWNGFESQCLLQLGISSCY